MFFGVHIKCDIADVHYSGGDHDVSREKRVVMSIVWQIKRFLAQRRLEASTIRTFRHNTDSKDIVPNTT